MNIGSEIQIVDVDDKKAKCEICGHAIGEFGKAEYLDYTYNFPDRKHDFFKCKECGSTFKMQHKIFDSEDHIRRSVFISDPNDPEDSWQSVWTKEQLATIEKHLANCQICKDRLNEEMLSDAWLADLIHGCGKTKTPKQHDN